MTRRSRQREQGSGTIRIIGGQWRGRRLPVPGAAGLRPTGDRVRETLFNWLAPILPGARCLDLFAGSGALGLEALSRGAGSCEFIDSNPRVLDHLRACLDLLAAGPRGAVSGGDAVAFLERREASGEAGCYDVVFLDPPFDAGLLDACCEVLFRGSLVGVDGLVYTEASAQSLDALALPAGWGWLRRKRAGNVDFALLRRGDAGT